MQPEWIEKIKRDLDHLSRKAAHYPKFLGVYDIERNE